MPVSNISFRGGPPANPSAATAQIVLKRSKLKFAPEAIEFDLELTGFNTVAPVDPTEYNPQRHEIYALWDFGDTGSTFDKPINVLTHQRDANTMNGWPASHTYTAPGSYTVSVLVVEPSSGKTATATFNLSGSEAVVSADTVFANDTYLIDPDGLGDYLTLNEAYINTRFNTLNRYVLAADKTHDGISKFSGTSVPSNGTIFIQGEAGVGKPVVTHTNEQARIVWIADFAAGNTVDVVMSNLELRSFWNEDTENFETAITGNPPFAVQVDALCPEYFLMHDCVTVGTSTGAYLIEDPDLPVSPKGAFLSDCSFESFQGFGMIGGSQGTLAFLGCKVARAPTALAGGPRNVTHNDHSGVRIALARKLIVQGCDVFANAGWFENDFGFQTAQPCLRLFSTGWFNEATNIGRNTLEGGGLYPIDSSVANSKGSIYVKNIVIDGNIIIGSYQFSRVYRTGHGGNTIRNNVIVVPNPQERLSNGSFGIRPAFAFATVGNTYGATQAQLDANYAAPNLIYNNTYASEAVASAYHSSVTNDSDIWFENVDYDVVSQENNVVRAPNLGAGFTADAPLDATSIFNARMLGYRAGYELFNHTQPTDVLNGGSFTIDYAAGRGASDYTANNTNGELHELKVGASIYLDGTGIAVSFDAGQITITNNTGVTLAAGDFQFLALAFDSPPARLDQYATPPATPALYAPQTGSAAIGDANTGQVAYTDFYGAVRGADPSRGALEPA